MDSGRQLRRIVGLSAGYHESAACLLAGGELVAAAEEERFTRVKHDARIPERAFRYCLREGGLSIGDVDAIAYYEHPRIKLARQLWSGHPDTLDRGLPWLDSHRIEREIREVLGYQGRIFSYEHHQSHAAASFFYSGFDRAAILTVDGVGEWSTTTFGVAEGSTLRILEEVHFPHSLGLLYSTVTAYLGFRVNSGEYKVMGLAPYGKPRFADALRRVLRLLPDGGFELDLSYFAFLRTHRMYSPAFEELLGFAPRASDAPLEQHHMDLAKSMQVVLEEALLEKVRYLHALTGVEDLCMSGGVALNSVANGRIVREGPFRRLFVQPAAGDAGSALGAAALAHIEIHGARHTILPLRHVYLGPAYASDEIARLIEPLPVKAHDFRGDEPGLLDAIVDRLVKGKVVGWFHGRMEFGPRALGARSILADPRDPAIRERLNHLVKKREAFRPFAPSLLEEHAAEVLDMDRPEPFMLTTWQVREGQSLPGVTHVDGSARPHTVNSEVAPRFAALLRRFHARTGCPTLVNTSFNIRGEPIVCTPLDAVSAMAHSGIEVLVLEDFIIDREDVPPELLEWGALEVEDFARHDNAESVYTFL